VFLLKDGYHVAKIFTEEYRAELALPGGMRVLH
jgi:hypothetical protein